jgi:hypothetical protein
VQCNTIQHVCQCNHSASLYFISVQISSRHSIRCISFQCLAVGVQQRGKEEERRRETGRCGILALQMLLFLFS